MCLRMAIIAAISNTNESMGLLRIALVICLTSVRVSGQTDGEFDGSYHTYPGLTGSLSEVVIQSDDKALISGYITEYMGISYVKKLIRLTTTGSPDPTFNSSSITGNVRDFKFTPDQKIVVVGNATLTGSGRSSVRLTMNGENDNSFHQINTDNFVNAIGVLPSGKYLIGGSFTSIDGQSQSKLARLLASGELDETFVAPTELTEASVVIDLIEVQPDGKILLAGDFSVNEFSGFTRLNANGTIDQSFNLGSGAFSVNDIEVQDDGKILLGGSISSFSGQTGFGNIIRLNQNGSLDDTFNPNGSGFDRTVLELALAPDGKILVGGNYFSEYNGVQVGKGIARLNSNGSLDSSFDTGSGFASNPNVYALGVESNGNVIAGGANIVGYNGVQTGQLIRIHGTATGISETVFENFEVYPNPSSGAFSLRFTEYGYVTISVIDPLGKEVLSDSFTSNGAQSKIVDVTGVSSGVYTVRVQTGKGLFAEKLILQ